MPEIPPEYLCTSREIISFDERYKEICWWLDKRRKGWSLHDPDWDDVRQRVLIEISRVYDQFDPARGTFGQFVNKVITSRLKNIWRDEYGAYARPCVANGGCADNIGDNLCRSTPSGVQCAECPFYSAWQKKKGAQWAVQQTLPLENHANEVHSRSFAFVDSEEKVRLIDQRMKKRLTRQEWKAYKLLIRGDMEEEQVARELGFKPYRKKKGKKMPRMYNGYATILAFKKRFYEVAQEVVKELDIAA